MDFLKTLLAYMAATLVVAVESTSTPSVTPVPTPGPTPEGGTAIVEMTAGLPAAEETPTPTATVSLTPVPVPTITPNMRGYHNLVQGDKGEEVKRLQERLIELGYLPEGAADGAYGGQTRNAVRKFQYYNGLTVDGVAGRATQTNLFENPEIASNPEKNTPAPEEPTETPAPETEEPTETPAPEMTEAVEETAAPEEIDEAEAAAEPETEEPATTAEPETTEELEATTEPETEESEITAEPEETDEVEATAEPKTTAEMEETNEAEATAEPEITAEPETEESEVTMEPEETGESEATAEPEVTEEPEVTAEPEATEEPETTDEQAESLETEKIGESAADELVEHVDLDAQENETPAPTEVPIEIVYEDLAGWVALNERGDSLQWTELEDGVPVVRSPRLQRYEEDIRISLDDLCKSVEEWTLTDEGDSLVLEAQGYTLALLNEDAGFVATVDGLEMLTAEGDFEFAEGHFIRVDFLTRALDGTWEWDAEEETLIIRIPQKNAAQYND